MTDTLEADNADTAAADTTQAATDATATATTDTAQAAATTTDAPAQADAAASQTDDWRGRMAGDDEKLKGFLSRVPSEKELVRRLKQYDDDFKAGRYIKPLADDASDEDKAAYRKASGIPDSIDGYLEKLPNALVIGDDDRGELGLDPYLAAFHELNLPKAASDKLIALYKGQVDAVAAWQAEEVSNADAEYVDQKTAALKEEWGADYKRNLNVANNYIATLPDDVKAAFLEGRGADGRPLGANPKVISWLTGLAMEANPYSTVAPNNGGDQAAAVGARVAEIKAMMTNRDGPYWKGDGAAKIQQEYRDLLEAQERAKPR